MLAESFSDNRHFYPRSPCGERHPAKSESLTTYLISIHALLAESDPAIDVFLAVWAVISIHALLAESDIKLKLNFINQEEFLSTLSLRRATEHAYLLVLWVLRFLSTLSLRRATAWSASKLGGMSISIHALLAESDGHHSVHYQAMQGFLSTLSLRRATPRIFLSLTLHKHFYPRSPCGERRLAGPSGPAFLYNFYPRSPCGERLDFYAV